LPSTRAQECARQRQAKDKGQGRWCGTKKVAVAAYAAMKAAVDAAACRQIFVGVARRVRARGARRALSRVRC